MREGGGTLFVARGFTPGLRAKWTKVSGPGTLTQRGTLFNEHGVSSATWDAGAATSGQTVVVKCEELATGIHATYWLETCGASDTDPGWHHTHCNFQSAYPSARTGPQTGGRWACRSSGGQMYYWSPGGTWYALIHDQYAEAPNPTLGGWPGTTSTLGAYGQMRQRVDFDVVSTLTFDWISSGYQAGSFGASSPFSVYVSSNANPAYDTATDRVWNKTGGYGGTDLYNLDPTGVQYASIDVSAQTGTKWLILRACFGQINYSPGARTPCIWIANIAVS